MRGVVSGESPSAWPTEALKAQAVAARTYAITTHAGGAAFDQYADTRSQVYRGVAAETPNTDAAVQATTGQVVTFGGQPVTTYFFSTSGGETEDVENSFVGSQPKPWLKAVDDPFDSVSPKHRWGPYRFTAAQVQRKLHRYLQGRFKRIKVLQRGVSPRVVRAQVVGTGGVHERHRAAAALGLRALRHVGLLHLGDLEGEQAEAQEAGGARRPRPATRPAASRRSPARPPRTRRAWRARSPRRGSGAGCASSAARARAGSRRPTRTVLRGGRYSVAVPGPGVYRVVYGQAVGPSVRVS